MSDDGQSGLVLIAFIGSVFSPYYARACRRTVADPWNHCALNVALYGRGGRWAMTERERTAVEASATSFAIGPSVLHWTPDGLVAEIDEITVPLPSRLRGRILLHAARPGTEGFDLDADGNHRWFPLAARARVEVQMSSPQLNWSGTAYLDSNAGSYPLSHDFDSWHWSRGHGTRDTVVAYDVATIDGERRSLSLCIHPDTTIEALDPIEQVRLPRTRWAIERYARADAGEVVVRKTLEDTPFYARSMLGASLYGEQRTIMHESLSLRRFDMPLVRAMLPFRMPRATRPWRSQSRSED